jgi:hypothetical protein
MNITKKSNKIFKYYRCTHKSKTQRCSQRKYLSEDKLAQQILGLTKQISIDNDIYEKLKQKSASWTDIELKNQSRDTLGLKTDLKTLETRINHLLDLHLDGEVNLSEYKQKKSDLVNQKVLLEEKVKELESGQSNWLEPELNFLKTYNQAHHSVSNLNFIEMSKILKKTGSNRKIREQKLSIQFLEPFNFLSEFKSQSGNNISREKINLDNNLQTLQQSRDSLAQQDRPLSASAKARAGRAARRAASQGLG